MFERIIIISTHTHSFRLSVQLDMLILSFISSLLVTSCFAAPSRRENGCLPAGLMDLPAHQTQLVAPKDAPSFVTVAVGNRNYTCSSSGKYT